MLPSLDSLRCFIAAADQLNFRAAAKSVALSPGALSQRIRQLESQLDVTLFERTTRRVSLSPAGQALVPAARRTLEEARRCLEAVRERVDYGLTIGTRFELGLSWLVPSLTPLERLRPERRLNLEFGSSPELLERAHRGTIDAVVTSARLSEGDFRYEVLHEETYSLVCRRPKGRSVVLRGASDARTHVLLDLHEDLPLFRYFLDARPPGEVWQFARVEYLGTIAAVRHRVLEGVGLAVLPRYFVRREVRTGDLRVLLPTLGLQRDFFRLVWRAGHPREAELRQLAADLRGRPLEALGR
jgi:DNA-binding transcriptional LysR family regulator